VVRFADRERHLLFLEPEGLNTHRVYVNGMSTSLPKDVQEEMLRAVPGLEDAVIMQYGYAVEYDFADPRDLDMGLQHRSVRGLYLAGQVNGTSGYEEAAAQGFIAGVSAALGEPFVCARDEAYIGVMIDDLVTRGVGGEPYRMFTSRAEHRLILREDNADRRLMARGRALGLVEDDAWELYTARQQSFDAAMLALRSCQVVPNAASREQLEAWGLGGLKKPSSGEQLLRRPGATWGHLVELLGLPELDRTVAEQVEIEVKYAGYIERATRRAEASSRWDSIQLPSSVDWSSLSFLSTEVRQRLEEATPQTLGQVGRLPGVTPAAVNALGMWLQSQKRASGGAGV
jgi:tRNA uridine 5-carboxymethylaminomethyl modification enzyme